MLGEDRRTGRCEWGQSMCGLIAFVASRFDAQAERALGALADRGPDRHSLLRVGEAVLGHARLSVIDLETGDQPMQSADGRYSIAYNGEIYNFRRLRTELEEQGARFRTRSDTEVLLHAYAIWGPQFVVKLDGMFAFALWDRDRRRMFCARDRMGVKPLFYSLRDGLALASTLAPFLAIEGFPRRLDYVALRDYLALQTIPWPRSFLRDVAQLPPATTLTYDAETGQHELASFWVIPHSTCATDLEDTAMQADELLRASVRAQTVADVPIGAFLSGGIDSSLIVHYLASGAASVVNTFSVKFPGAQFDESPAALAVARQYGTRHQVLEARDIGADDFMAAIGALDQPLADPSYLPLSQVAQLARGSVTVALSGDGADELFGGYGRFLKTEASYPASWRQRLLRAALDRGLIPEAVLRRTLHGKQALLYDHVETGPWRAGRKAMSRYVAPEFLDRMECGATAERWLESAATFGDPITTLGLMRADLWTYLADNCLVKADRASMRHGLELRVPFLGNAMIDLGLGVPPEMHFSEGRKTILRKLAKQHLPEVVWDRPKHGFSVPLAYYFNGSWRDCVNDLLDQCGALAPFLEAGAVRRQVQAARQGKGSIRLAYTFIVLLAWLRKYQVETR